MSIEPIVPVQPLWHSKLPSPNKVPWLRALALHLEASIQASRWVNSTCTMRNGAFGYNKTYPYPLPSYKNSCQNWETHVEVRELDQFHHIANTLEYWIAKTSNKLPQVWTRPALLIVRRVRSPCGWGDTHVHKPASQVRFGCGRGRCSDSWLRHRSAFKPPAWGTLHPCLHARTFLALSSKS